MAGNEQNQDLIDVIVSDHRNVEEVFVELENDAVTPERRKELVDHAITELVRHSVAEEQHMYPVARRVLEDGDQVAEHEIQEHAEAESVMKELEGMDATDSRYDELVRSLVADIRHHVADEESELLPRLRRACSQEELMELGRKVANAKKTAPTRPHPKAPDTPPANRLLDPGAGMIDRMRDALTGQTTRH
ncbi:hemerythrin-like domain-containing protein [Lipingzhangella halophila]|uniref:Hemerythrin-like domain-containing protein n=1 Tax=Lipingzhangella halophila TaxID=1783352 RepID=A0A7W7REG8_9ACTN|nr:hemerythrin domain-containing protein [Lipingzhangella halophila]MBB4930497.1 hemerythrin-like domain-containing protein [Lipingzhangella halophila]